MRSAEFEDEHFKSKIRNPKSKILQGGNYYEMAN